MHESTVLLYLFARSQSEVLSGSVACILWNKGLNMDSWFLELTSLGKLTKVLAAEEKTFFSGGTSSLSGLLGESINVTVHVAALFAKLFMMSLGVCQCA